jgi:ketosteroid isomerase-like protein
MTEQEKIIHKFYTSFANADSASMVELYDDEINFTDPVFGILKGEQAKSMWKMLVRPGVNISFSDIKSSRNKVYARWQAEYTYTPTSRKVVNKIKAEFEIKDGKIVSHKDTFSLWKWSSQALGPVGLMLGWTNKVKHKIRSKANAALRKYMEAQSK